MIAMGELGIIEFGCDVEVPKKLTLQVGIGWQVGGFWAHEEYIWTQSEELAVGEKEEKRRRKKLTKKT